MAFISQIEFSVIEKGRMYGRNTNDEWVEYASMNDAARKLNGETRPYS